MVSLAFATVRRLVRCSSLDPWGQGNMRGLPPRVRRGEEVLNGDGRSLRPFLYSTLTFSPQSPGAGTCHPYFRGQFL